MVILEVYGIYHIILVTPFYDKLFAGLAQRSGNPQIINVNTAGFLLMDFLLPYRKSKSHSNKGLDISKPCCTAYLVGWSEVGESHVE
jgi:hypothetical protein